MSLWRALTARWRREFPRHPSRRQFVEGVAYLLDARYGASIEVRAMRNHPVSHLPPELILRLPEGGLGIVTFGLCRHDWPDLHSKGFRHVPDMEMIGLIEWRERLAEANPDETFRLVHITDRQFNAIDTICFHRYGLDVLSGIWADPYDFEKNPETGGARDAARWLGRLFKLQEVKSDVGAA